MATHEDCLDKRLNSVIAALDRLGQQCLAIQRAQGDAKWRAVGGLIYQVWEARTMLGLPEIDGLRPINQAKEIKQ